MSNMKKYVIIYTVAVLVAAGVASGASWHARVGPSMESTNPPFVISNRSLAPDLADPKIKLGLSSNVFVAKVLERIGDESDATQFRVKAILNIQGDVQGTG